MLARANTEVGDMDSTFVDVMSVAVAPVARKSRRLMIAVLLLRLGLVVENTSKEMFGRSCTDQMCLNETKKSGGAGFWLVVVVAFVGETGTNNNQKSLK
jgi:hypothetical protein